MSKQKRNIIAVVLCLIMLAFAILLFFIAGRQKPKKDNESNVVSSNVSSAINVEDIGSERCENESEANITESEIEFIEPDETEADKILEGNKNTTSSTVSSKTSNTSSVTKTESSKPSVSSGSQSFEDGKTALESKALKYLKEHNIDPNTAGETGELCQHCGKKIWNPDKYGAFIPGMPEDYENSGYCLGTCAISFE